MILNKGKLKLNPNFTCKSKIKYLYISFCYFTHKSALYQLLKIREIIKSLE